MPPPASPAGSSSSSSLAEDEAPAASGYYCASEMQGRRESMEDTHCVHHAALGDRDLVRAPASIFGVFDGHGGSECARFCARNLCQRITEHAKFATDPVTAVRESFMDVDAHFLTLARDLELNDGSTGTVLVLWWDAIVDRARYCLAMAGDSRAVLVDTEGAASALLDDHVPTRESERNRVKEAGGFVLYDEQHDMYRVASARGGGLAVTRAFGDINFKPSVTAEPEIRTGVVEADDAFIVLASDGLWGDVGNNEVGRVLTGRGLEEGTEYLINEAYERGSDDNITVIAVDLQRAAAALRAHARTVGSPLPVGTPPSPAIASPFQLGSTIMEQLMGSSSSDTGSGSRSSASMAARPLSGRSVRSMRGKKRYSSSAASVRSGVSDVDDVEVPGFPTVFTSDLLLWRSPLRSLAWFLVINGIFGLVILGEFPLVSLGCLGLLGQLMLRASIFRAATLAKRLNYLPEDVEPEDLAKSHLLISARTIVQFSDVAIASIVAFCSYWSALVYEGSTTRVLLALRTISYFYTPVPFSVVAWVVFVALFTVPAIWARYNVHITDALLAGEVRGKRLYDDKVKPHVEPHMLKVQKEAAKIREAAATAFPGLFRHRPVGGSVIGVEELHDD